MPVNKEIKKDEYFDSVFYLLRTVWKAISNDIFIDPIRSLKSWLSCSWIYWSREIPVNCKKVYKRAVLDSVISTIFQALSSAAVGISISVSVLCKLCLINFEEKMKCWRQQKMWVPVALWFNNRMVHSAKKCISLCGILMMDPIMTALVCSWEN